jgi:hypothetical protein
MVAARERHDPDAARTIERRPIDAAATIFRDDIAALAIDVPDQSRLGPPTAAL